MKNHLIYQVGSNTIRQMPQNYKVAFKTLDGWICHPDMATDPELCVEVLKALMIFENRYGSGENLLKVVNENLEAQNKFTVDTIRIASIPVGKYPELEQWVKQNLGSSYQDNGGDLSEHLYSSEISIESQKAPKIVNSFREFLGAGDYCYFRFEQA